MRFKKAGILISFSGFLMFLLIVMGAFTIISSILVIGNMKSNSSTSEASISILTDEMIRGAVASQEKYKVPASIILGQIILESRGNYPLPDGKYSKLAWEDKNLFGIKGRGDLGYKTYETSEYDSTKKYRIYAKFAKFSSFAKAIDFHGKLLASPLYANRVSNKADANSWADALTGVYATAPNYGSMLKSIMNDNDLYKFNTMSSKDLKAYFGKTTFKEGKNVNEKQKKIVEVALSYKDPYNNGYKKLCEKWVGDVYERAGLSYQRSHCASYGRDRFAIKGKEIPVGALIYSAPSYKSTSRCSCGRNAGHVGIYIGGGRVLSSMPRFNISLTEFIKIYGYGGYSFNEHEIVGR